MKSKLHLVQVAEAEEPRGVQMPDHVQLSLAGIAGQAKDGLLALAVSTGLAVLHETMEWEVDRIAGPKGRHDAERTAKRHGHTGGEVTLGGRRVAVSRPRVRTADDAAEIGLESYREFADRACWSRWRLSGCWLASRPVGLVGSGSPSASRPSRRRGRRQSRRCRARSSRGPAPRLSSCWVVTCPGWSWRQ